MKDLSIATGSLEYQKRPDVRKSIQTPDTLIITTQVKIQLSKDMQRTLF